MGLSALIFHPKILEYHSWSFLPSLPMTSKCTTGFGMFPSSLACLDQPDDVALGIGELRERDHVRDHSHRHDGLAAHALDLVEVSLRVVDLDVEGDTLLLALPDPTVDPLPAVSDHPIVHLGRDLHLPVKRLAVELLKLCAILADDLKPRYWIGHTDLL